MTTPSLATPSATLKILRQFDFKPSKRLGQHFLVDRNILGKIVEAADLSAADTVLEIGPGIGTLTVPLAQLAKSVVALDFDPRLLPVLDYTVGRLANVKVIIADALRFDLRDIEPDKRPNKLVSNLPYQIASPLLARFLDEFKQLKTYVVMVQKEVADRILARPGGKDYGSLSVKVQYYCQVERIASVSRHVFIPAPEVDSTVVRLVRLPKSSIEVRDEACFFKVVRAAFGGRRKTLRNALSTSPELKLTSVTANKALEQAGIDPKRRGETLSLTEFGKLSETICPAE